MIGRDEKVAAPDTLRVVIVDDDEDLAEELKEMLMAGGYAVEAATESMTAPDFIRRARPHIVLLDIKMKGKDGFQVARELADDPDMAGVLIIAMTGYCTRREHDVLRAIPGVREILLKPFSYDDVVARIEAVRQAR